MRKISDKYLDFIENLADRIPDPFFIFIILSIIVAISSYIFVGFDIIAIHPSTQEIILPKNMISVDGIQMAMQSMVKNFISFPPLGLVLTSMIGIGLADKSGFIKSAITRSVRSVPKSMVTPALIFVSVNSSIIADAGLVIMPPIGAILYKSIGRNPIAGVAVAFASVCGGFSANLSITALDPLLSGITDSAAKIIAPDLDVYPTSNYYFMIASVFIITAVCTLVDYKIVEPRLNKTVSDNKDDNPDQLNQNDQIESFPNELKALVWAIALIAIIILAFIVMIISNNSLFIDDLGTLAPLYKSIIPLIVILFFIPGLIFGIIIGRIKSTKDVAKMLTESMSGMGGYIILAFSASQFIEYFDWSNLGIISAIKGAEFLKFIGLTGIPLLIVFLILSSILNIFVYSASAKWAIVAPIVVPMFILMDISPATTQMIYRVGDSITNTITPLLPYFPIALAVAIKYDKQITLGKLISALMPYSIFLMIIWGTISILWVAIGLPLGPGT